MLRLLITWILLFEFILVLALVLAFVLAFFLKRKELSELSIEGASTLKLFIKFLYLWKNVAILSYFDIAFAPPYDECVIVYPRVNWFVVFGGRRA